MLSSDLDIFGDDPTENEDTTREWGGDIFGETTDNGTKLPSEDPMFTEEPKAPEAEEPEEVKEPSETPAEEKVEETIEDDPELSKLFEEIDREIAGDTKLKGLVDKLKTENSDLLTELAIANKKNETLNEKLINSAGSEADLGIYRPVIQNLEDNPKLMLVAKYMGKQWDNEKVKTRLVGALADMLEELTWENVSSLIDTNQTDKIMSVNGKTGSTTSPLAQPSKDEEEWNFQDSTKNLF